MGLSTTQQFLVEATRVVGAEDYFDPRAVGKTLGFSNAQRDEAMNSLGERKLIIALVGGQARLLDAGRQFAIKLETKLRARAQ